MSSICVDADRLRVVRDQLAPSKLRGTRARRRLPPLSRLRCVPRRRPQRRRRRAPASCATSRHATAVPATTGACAAGTASSRSSIRDRSPRNSKRRNISRSCGPVRRREHELRGIAVELEVAPHRRELLRRARLVGELRQVLLPRGRLLLRVLEHRLERAVLRDQLPGRLVADARDAGDVVRGVALQPDEVRNLIGPDPVARLDALRRVDLHVADAARRHHQADVLGARAGTRRGRSRRRTCGCPARRRRVASVAITSSASQPSNSRLR